MRQRYVVERLIWWCGEGGWFGLPGADRVATFATAAEAAREVDRREEALRARVNPFACAGPRLHYQTPLSVDQLVDLCLDLGLNPPGATTLSEVWAWWWKEGETSWSAEQRGRLWDALARVRFFRWREEEPSREGRLVAKPIFEVDAAGDEPVRPTYVGSEPRLFVFDPAVADGYCLELWQASRAAAGETATPDRGFGWEPPVVDPFAAVVRCWQPEEQTSYWEHRPVPYHGAEPRHAGQELYVVVRRPWRLVVERPSTWRWTVVRSGSCGTAIAVFDSLASADQFAARLEAEARGQVEPFRFGPPHEWSHAHPALIYRVLADLATVDFTRFGLDYRTSDQLWIHWWDEVAPAMTPEQIDVVWRLYDRLRFYQVVAIEYRE